MFGIARVGMRAICLALIALSSSHAEVVGQHVEDTDPLNEGWSVSTDQTGTVTSGPIDDSGTKAWFVRDPSEGLGSTRDYAIYLSNAQLCRALTSGWTLRGRLRVPGISENVDGAINISFHTRERPFSMAFGSDVDGDPTVQLSMGSIDNHTLAGPKFTVEGGAEAYHEYELIYDPTSGTADLFVDGVERLSDYQPPAETFATGGIHWGSGDSLNSGSANYAFVEFVVANGSCCGQGTVEMGFEECDDGNTNGGDGCSSTCTVEQCYSCAGSPSVCMPLSGVPCEDGSACTEADLCSSGVCAGGPPVTCGLCQTCAPVGGCAENPRPTCKVPTEEFKAALLVKDQSPDAGDQVSFRWSKGMATTAGEFGDPLTADDYALCVFGPDSSLLIPPLVAPAGGTCGSKPCWKALGPKGFRYNNPSRLPDGTQKVDLRAGLQGKARTQFKAKGPHLPTLSLPLSLPVTAQLQSENGQCWEATFLRAVTRNDGLRFKAKSD